MQDRTELLLDYAHDRLTDAGRTEVEALLETDPALQAEMAAIKAVQAEFAADGASQEDRVAGWREMSAAIDADRARTPANENRRFTLFQLAAVAAVAVIGVQLISYTVLPRGDGAGFVPAGATAEGETLQIAFRADARVDQITDLLRALDATIVDGPSAIGILTLQFEDAAARDAALSTLREQSDVVDLVSQP